MAISERGVFQVGIVNLSKNRWWLATDPENVGQKAGWFNVQVPSATEVAIPHVIQQSFPSYHGVVWYWTTLPAWIDAGLGQRCLLRFWAVDYKADVWVNGQPAGNHEGAEAPFVFDVTDLVQEGKDNLIAVRVLNPTIQRIDGMTLGETPRRCKVEPFYAGAAFNHGGIMDEVECLTVAPVYIQDLHCIPAMESESITVHLTAVNTTTREVNGRFSIKVSEAAGGCVMQELSLSQTLVTGETVLEVSLPVAKPRLWQLNDPFLYRVNGRVETDESDLASEMSTRCGFRRFWFEDGYFRLNGARIFLRCSHTCNHFPIGLQMPHEPGLWRRDLLNAKAMGFNMVRFIWGGATRLQLDYCDEIGLLVYQETFAAYPMVDSPQMADRFDRVVSGMILRDRNHPCVVIWALLNETQFGAVFNHAVQMLALIRSLDEERMVMLNSGRFDGQLSIGSLSNPGSHQWECLMGAEGDGGGVAKMTALTGYVKGVGDVHAYPRVPQTAAATHFLRTVGSDSKNVFLSEYGIGSAVDLWRTVRHFETLGATKLNDAQFYRKKLDEFLVDWNRWRLDECFDRPEDFFQASLRKMPGQRSMGLCAIRSNPKIAGYSMTGLIDHGLTGEGLTTPFREFKSGTIDALAEGWAPLRFCLFVDRANIFQGTKVKLELWLADEDVLAPGQYHIRVQLVSPDRKRIIDQVVTYEVLDPGVSGESPMVHSLFMEDVLIDGLTGTYRLLATFEHGAAATCGSLEFHVLGHPTALSLNKPVVLWNEDRVLQSWLEQYGVSVMSRKKGCEVDAPIILVPVGDGPERGLDPTSLKEKICAGSTAIFLTPDAFKPRSMGGAKVSISESAHHQVFSHYEVPNVSAEEAKYFKQVLWGDFTISTSELKPGAYIVQLEMCEGWQSDFGMRLFDVAINREVVLENFDIFKEAGGKGLAITRRFNVEVTGDRIDTHFIDRLAGAAVNRLRIYDLQNELVAEYSAVGHQGAPAFIYPEFGDFTNIEGWLYLKDEWAKDHPIFDGLPSGGLMSYDFYGELIPDALFAPSGAVNGAIAGAIKASQDYSAGLMVVENRWGAGRFIVNTLRLTENLTSHPAAGQLLLNMLKYADS